MKEITKEEFEEFLEKWGVDGFETPEGYFASYEVEFPEEGCGRSVVDRGNGTYGMRIDWWDGRKGNIW